MTPLVSAPRALPKRSQLCWERSPQEVLSLKWMAPKWGWTHRVPTRVLNKAPSPAPTPHCPASHQPPAQEGFCFAKPPKKPRGWVPSVWSWSRCAVRGWWLPSSASIPPARHWIKRDWPKALGHAHLFMNIVGLQAAYRLPAEIKPHSGQGEIKAMACATGAAQPRPQK